MMISEQVISKCTNFSWAGIINLHLPKPVSEGILVLGGKILAQEVTQSIRSVRRSRVTISDVAEKLGLTKGTVSRALNGYPDISDSTRHRVRRQAESMGYSPLAQAQAIRTGRTRALGLVLQTDVPDSQRPFLSDFLAGVTTAASSENWTVTVATSAGDDEMLTTLSRLVEEHKADGFILPRSFYHDPRVELLRRLEVPFVLFGRVAEPEGCAWFDILGEEAMREAVHKLTGHGHSRIAFVNGGMQYTYSHLRAQGFWAGMREVGLDIDQELMRENATSMADGAQATRALLSHPNPPTAIVFAVDMAALGAYGPAAERGLAIGQHLSIISYDGIPEGAWAQPPLTTFEVDSRNAGERLVQLLIRRIRGAAPEELRETALAKFHAGGSDGPPTLTSAEIAAMVARKRQN
jgi:LacI family transcriptional regulator